MPSKGYKYGKVLISKFGQDYTDFGGGEKAAAAETIFADTVNGKTIHAAATSFLKEKNKWGDDRKVVELPVADYLALMEPKAGTTGKLHDHCAALFAGSLVLFIEIDGVEYYVCGGSLEMYSQYDSENPTKVQQSSFTGAGNGRVDKPVAHRRPHGVIGRDCIKNIYDTVNADAQQQTAGHTNGPVVIFKNCFGHTKGTWDIASTTKLGGVLLNIQNGQKQIMLCCKVLRYNGEHRCMRILDTLCNIGTDPTKWPEPQLLKTFCETHKVKFGLVCREVAGSRSCLEYFVTPCKNGENALMKDGIDVGTTDANGKLEWPNWAYRLTLKAILDFWPTWNGLAETTATVKQRDDVAQKLLAMCSSKFRPETLDTDTYLNALARASTFASTMDVACRAAFLQSIEQDNKNLNKTSTAKGFDKVVAAAIAAANLMLTNASLGKVVAALVAHRSSNGGGGGGGGSAAAAAAPAGTPLLGNTAAVKFAERQSKTLALLDAPERTIASALEQDFVKELSDPIDVLAVLTVQIDSKLSSIVEELDADGIDSKFAIFFSAAHYRAFGDEACASVLTALLKYAKQRDVATTLVALRACTSVLVEEGLADGADPLIKPLLAPLPAVDGMDESDDYTGADTKLTEDARALYRKAAAAAAAAAAAKEKKSKKASKKASKKGSKSASGGSSHGASEITADGHFNIPEGTKTITATSLEKWGVDKQAVETVTIPDTVTRIGLSAFDGCTSLASITFSGSVTSIGKWAFHKCTSLASITILGLATDIHIGAFSGCSSLVSVTIPDTRLIKSAFPESIRAAITTVALTSGCVAIGDRAFSECSALGSVTIPDSVTSIGDYAFYGCRFLASITIPDSVTSIGEEALHGCTSLTTLIAPLASTLTVAADKPSFFGDAAGVFTNCPNLKLVSAPDQIVAALKEPYAAYSTLAELLAELPPAVTQNAFKLQLDTYLWSMNIHRHTNRLSAKQRAWIKHLLTVGSRVRLHWRPFNKGPRSVACIPTPGHPPLPCIMNDIWLLVLKFVRLSELGVY